MNLGQKTVFISGCCALLMLICGFTADPSHRVGRDVIVTAAPSYEPLAALRGAERFPKGAQLLLIQDGQAEPLVKDFASTADASVSYNGQNVLFAGKKSAADKWQIWELTLRDGSVRQVTAGQQDAIRPLYLPGWRFVYALRTAAGFQMQSARISDSKALADVEGPGVQAEFPISFLGSSIPEDVLTDGRILFSSGFPLGSAGQPELFLVYSDGSGVESYRCDHGAARWGGRQVSSGDVVFTHGSTLARFTSPLAHEERIAATAAEYAGGIAELSGGEWLLSERASPSQKFALKLWKPGSPLLRTLIAQADMNLVEPVVVGEHAQPHRHPSALHDWNYANLLAQDARVSREGGVNGTPAAVRLETQDAGGKPVVMGTAPVEADGSFFVKAPADRAIRFALLDAKGKVLRQEQGWFWSRRGEQRICVGCHAGPEHASENRVPAVLLRTTTPEDLTGQDKPAQALSGLPGGN